MKAWFRSSLVSISKVAIQNSLKLQVNRVQSLLHYCPLLCNKDLKCQGMFASYHLSRSSSNLPCNKRVITTM